MRVYLRDISPGHSHRDPFALFRFQQNCHATFTQMDSGIFINPAPSLNVVRQNLNRLACFENEHNRIHFESTLGETLEEQWKNNLALARAVKMIWQAQLIRTFPQVDFALVILNEPCVYEDGELIAVQPVLRMWTIQNDYNGDLHNVFAAGTDHSEDVWTHPEFIPAGEFFRSRS